MNLISKKITLLVLLLLTSIKTFSQVANYPFTQSSSSYAAITGGTVFGSTTSDDEYFVDATVPLGGFVTTGVGMPIGFNFVFNGNVYDRFGISNNGWISLGQSTLTPNAIDMNTGSSYNPLSSTSSASVILQNKIAGLARDLQGQTGSELRTETIGSAPNRTLVVQFLGYQKFASTGDNFNFQIRLSETTNKVDVVYGTFTTTTSGSAQVGLRGTVITDFNNRDVSVSNAWNTSIAGALNSAIVNFNSTLTPVSGQNYQWAPPPNCSGTPNSGIASISSTTGCPNASFSLTATGLSVASGLTFQWQSAPSASGPWTNIIGATTVNYTTSTSSTIYYQLVTTCTVSALSATSSVVSYSVVNPGPCVCGGYANSAASSTADEEMYNVTFGSLNSTSSCTTIAPGIGSLQNRYSNYTGFLASPNVMQGQSVPFSLQVGTCGGNFNNSCAIYIDYNQNGSFTDPGEQAYLSTATTNGPHFETGNVNIPLTALVGTTRMRVIVNETVPASITPTNVYTWGETEDYCINIIASTNCAGSPNSGTASISTPTGCPNTAFTLNATGLTVAGGLTYQWQSAPSASGPWTNIIGATTVNYTTTATATTYYQMVTTCTISAQSATTSVVSYSVINPGPCVCNPYGQSAATSTFDEEILNVSFGTLNNPSTCTTVAPGPGSAQNLYSNYSGFLAAPSVLQGQNVPFGVTLGTCNGWYGMSLNIYIDYNQNGLFTDPGELTYSTTTAIQGNNTGNILVPPTASVGTTRMRVVAVEGSVPGPTGTYSWGETEDYCITIVTPTPCAGTPNSGFSAISTPTGCISDVFTLNASSVTVAGGISYQWQSSPSASGPWTNMPGGTSVSFTASAANTTFYQMVTTCSTSAQSATTTIVSYTPSNCYIMSNTTVTACGGTLYDSGGPNNNYQSNEDYTMTIIPSTPSASVMLTFLTFSTEPTFDFLYVYDGNSTAAPLIGTYDGNTLPPVITASNSAGILTLEFTSDGSVQYTGFSASISCFTPCAGPPAAPTATASNICAGGQSTLTATVTGTPKWYATSTSTNYIAVGNPFITPTLTSNITYYVKDSSACGISSVTAITVSVSPAQTLTAIASNTNICLGNSATLTASGVSTYTWSNNSTQSVIVVTPTTNTTYSVIGHSNLCNTNQSAVISLSVNPTPTVTLVAGATTICAGAGSISLSGSPSGGVYSGAAVNGTLLSIANPGTFTPMYSYTNSTTGCSNTATTTVIVANCTGLNNNGTNNGLVTIYPNPTNGIFVLSTSSTSNKSIEITDVTGKVVLNQTSSDEKIQINMNEKANGVYYLKLISDKTTLVFKVIKQ